MNAAEAITNAINTSAMISNMYLDDLSDEEMLVRPCEGANHIKWQLGHLISSENKMIEAVCPGSMPPLPDGFADKYDKETSKSDNPAAFAGKDEYLKLHNEQRLATLKALEGLSDDDLAKPAPEMFERIAKTVDGIFSMQANHWTMHAGQWAVIRRQLGRPPLF